MHFLHALNDRTIADVVSCLAVQMQDQGLDTVVVASAVTPGARHPKDVEVIDLGGSGTRTLSALGPLAKALRGRTPSTVFAHAAGPARAAFMATRGMRRPPRLIGIIHNHYSSYAWSQARVRRKVDGSLLPRLDGLVGVSPGVANDLATTFPAAADRVRMIPPPLTRWTSLSTLAGEPIDHPWFDDKRPVIVTVGHVHPRKDHETLIRAMATLCVKGTPSPRLIIIGSDTGPHADRIRALIRDMGLNEDIALLGTMTNPMPYIAAADAFVLSSVNEGFGIVLLEAMGVGTPIVSTDAPSGPRWVLNDGNAGLLVPVGDATALAAAIGRVLDDRGLRQRLTAAGKNRASEFSPARIARSYLDLAEAP